MARELKPDNAAECALSFIQRFQLDVAQIMYRYTVAQIDDMCAEIGLPPIEGEKEEGKATRLHEAVNKGMAEMAMAISPVETKQ